MSSPQCECCLRERLEAQLVVGWYVGYTQPQGGLSTFCRECVQMSRDVFGDDFFTVEDVDVGALMQTTHKDVSTLKPENGEAKN